VLDSAALFLALSPSSAPVVPARLCLRRGFLCFRQIARAMEFMPSYDDPDPDAGISLTYEEFLDGVALLRRVDFPIERAPAKAWPDFVGWRVNYEQAAYALAFEVDAVPALWSGPAVAAPPPSRRSGPRSAGCPVRSGSSFGDHCGVCDQLIDRAASTRLSRAAAGASAICLLPHHPLA
jgi:hypothetical protein